MFESSWSDWPISSCPSSVAEPVTCALGGSRFMIASDETDLPEPDSPTMPSNSPGCTSLTAPVRLRNVTDKFETESSGRAGEAVMRDLAYSDRRHHAVRRRAG